MVPADDVFFVAFCQGRTWSTVPVGATLVDSAGVVAGEYMPIALSASQPHRVR